ncbi:proteinase-activated receptor 2-like [Chanos chanos]|uniref:Proteinase-activated receptor 2-like n=1 Tax=Chanos chanos TaxID=29144 RepID=A0A6J2V8N5_CHACN|nr:proteinase-activated receptor 2-like [Chanos chanos]
MYIYTDHPLDAPSVEEQTCINTSLFLTDRPNVSTVHTQPLLQRCKDRTEAILFYSTVQFVNLFLGSSANVMVLWLIVKEKRGSSGPDVFIMHLAILDTLFCLIVPLEFASTMYLTTSWNWYVLRFFHGIKDSSPLFLSCVCLDRYVAVMRPFTHTRLKDKPLRSICMAVIWTVTLLHAALYSAEKIPDIHAILMVTMLAALVFMMFCNISILWILRRSVPGQDNMHPQKKAAFQMVFIILVITLINYVPLVALFPFKKHFDQDVFKCYIHYIAFGFKNLSSSIQPVLYLSKRNKHELPGYKCCCSTETVNNSEPALLVFTVFK